MTAAGARARPGCSGSTPPPGDGPTVAVKDAIDVAGTVTTVGVAEP